MRTTTFCVFWRKTEKQTKTNQNTAQTLRGRFSLTEWPEKKWKYAHFFIELLLTEINCWPTAFCSNCVREASLQLEKSELIKIVENSFVEIRKMQYEVWGKKMKRGFEGSRRTRWAWRKNWFIFTVFRFWEIAKFCEMIMYQSSVLVAGLFSLAHNLLATRA